MNTGISIPSAPLSIAWNFTYSCNMNCEHCYSRTEQGKELTNEEQEYVTKQLIKAKILHINFGGGEPLIRPSFFFIAQLAKKFGIGISLSSNGWLIDNRVAKSLASIKVDVVSISIDSTNPEKHDKFRNCSGSFNRAIEAIKLLKQQGLKVKIFSVLSKINYKEVKELIKLAETLEVDELLFKNYKPAGKGLINVDRYDLTPQEWEKVYKKLIKFQRHSKVNIGLGAEPLLHLLSESPSENDENQSLIRGAPCGKLSLCIKPNGDITPCAYVNLVLGNMLKDDLLYIWQNSPILYQLRNKKPTGKCTKCPNFEWCQGGCFAAAYNTSGCIDAPDPHCWWQPN